MGVLCKFYGNYKENVFRIRWGKKKELYFKSILIKYKIKRI